MTLRKVEAFEPVTLATFVATAAATCSSTASRADATTVQPSTRIGCPTRRRCGRCAGGWSAPGGG
jgi:hypothetical protein